MVLAWSCFTTVTTNLFYTKVEMHMFYISHTFYINVNLHKCVPVSQAC